MRKVLFGVSILFLPCFFVRAGNPVRTVAPKIEDPLFEKAVSLVKESEGWHDNHWPYVAYGHRVLPQERLTANMTRAQGDSLLRADLRKRCVIFRKFGKDSLLLGVLSYQVGHSRLLGYGKYSKNKLIRKLEKGDRDIYREYVSFRCWRGKAVPSIERRRKREFELLYIP